MNHKEGEPQDEKNRNSGCLRGWELGRGKRALCDGGKVSLDRLGHTGVCIYQNSSNGILNICVFYCM